MIGAYRLKGVKVCPKGIDEKDRASVEFYCEAGKRAPELGR